MQAQLARRLCWLAVAFMLLALLALPFDLTVAQFWKHARLPSEVEKAIHGAEAFGHAIGVVGILLTVSVLDPPRRASVWRIAALALGSGVLANLIKLPIARWRPRSAPHVASVFETFAGWRWSAIVPEGRNAWASYFQSFPSAHSATATGLAIALSIIYPHGRWLFIGGATLACLQRVAVNAHFPSDVFSGAACACLWSAAMLQTRWARQGMVA